MNTLSRIFLPLPAPAARENEGQAGAGARTMSDPLRYYRFESFLAAEGWPVTDGWCREPRDDSDKRGRVLRYRHLRSVYQSAWMRSIGLPSPRLLLPGMPCPSSVIDR